MRVRRADSSNLVGSPEAFIVILRSEISDLLVEKRDPEIGVGSPDDVPARGERVRLGHCSVFRIVLPHSLVIGNGFAPREMQTVGNGSVILLSFAHVAVSGSEVRGQEAERGSPVVEPDSDSSL